MLQLLDVLFAINFHLFHDLFLSVNLTLKVLLFSERIIETVLEVLVLLGQDLVGFLSCLKLDLDILGEEHLILKVASLLKKFGIGSCVFLLFFLKSFDPLLPSFLLAG